MKKPDIKILIIPDVHGRQFWINPVGETLCSTDAHIVFLGDYLDEYPHEEEWRDVDDTRMVSLDRFRRIVELKKHYPDRVTLLIGNHDCGYCISEDINSSRMDRRHKDVISGLFNGNREMFRLAYDCEIADRHFVFSHAGILKGWAAGVWTPKEMADPEFNIIRKLNEAWLTYDFRVLEHLGEYDIFRGFGGSLYPYGGSPVWSDIRSWTKVTEEKTYGFNIVGHTQCREKPVLLDCIADLDCRRPFYIDSTGKIREFDSGEELQRSEPEEY